MSKKNDTKREQLADHVRDRDHSFREGYRHALRELQSRLADRMHEVAPQGQDLLLEVARWAQIKIERSL
jgi:hypothetical protein